ncbi:hypothetical protein Ahy_A07g033926 [Arachis hypogaea]|uniref:TIR domain-containing protein n=1 Tax=Arachis hypogaea TaxID=3818 RepID=A0A445CAG1_ARAHY|nr:hypothetical protein Ahy_A07g033926 [Arachis hypogaea]
MANHGVASFDYTYDVFLSFRRGVHRAFIDHLYKALDGVDIKIFKDDDEEESTTEEEETKPDLLEKIVRSRISVVVLCKDFPFSTRCLDEVAKIMECYDKKTMQVVGLFYDGVIAADVRWQKEDRAYGKAITQHKERLGLGEESEKIKTWRSALFRVCELIALNCDKKYETELISMIAKGVSARFPPLRKTTFAAYIYNNIINNQYIAASFISNIRDKPKVEDLQSTLLSEMGEKRESRRGDTDGGGREIKRKLSVKKVLLVLDGVDKIEQLKSLAGGCDWFGPGSKIIITTRDATLLNRHRVKIKRYQMTELSDDDSHKLSCWYAFDDSEPAQNFANLVPQALSIAKGVPLALKKLGSILKEWEMELDRYNKVPEAFEFLLKSFGN